MAPEMPSVLDDSLESRRASTFLSLLLSYTNRTIETTHELSLMFGGVCFLGEVHCQMHYIVASVRAPCPTCSQPPCL
eukprot:6265190-Prymnesium_polylepis.1